jgi:hypothetical protein
MKYLCLILVFSFLTNKDLISQAYKRDNRIQILKEDDNNMYKSDRISNLDLIEALEITGISINKFDLGSFDKQYSFKILIDEYKEGKNLKSDTIYDSDNTYTYFHSGSKEYNIDYIDQLKIFSKSSDSTLILYFMTYGMSISKEIQFKKYDKNSFYYFRSYFDTKWSLNEKIPLLIYASSWLDKEGGFQRFCGVVNLSKKSEKTNELLRSSPHYFLISYLIETLKK